LRELLEGFGDAAELPQHACKIAIVGDKCISALECGDRDEDALCIVLLVACSSFI